MVRLLASGVEMILHEYVRTVPASVSELSVPSSMTLAPIGTLTSEPALATGTEFPVAAVMVTLSAALLWSPSLTTSAIT